MVLENWYCCPSCCKKLFPVFENTVILNLPFKCKRCKNSFNISINKGKSYKCKKS